MHASNLPNPYVVHSQSTLSSSLPSLQQKNIPCVKKGHKSSFEPSVTDLVLKDSDHIHLRSIPPFSKVANFFALLFSHSCSTGVGCRLCVFVSFIFQRIWQRECDGGRRADQPWSVGYCRAGRLRSTAALELPANSEWYYFTNLIDT